MASEDLEPREVMAKYWNMPEMLYLKWMGMAAKIQQMNEIVNKQCVELTNAFRKDGFDVVVLKGQSCARRYQIRGKRFLDEPSVTSAEQEVSDLSMLRQSGDIDAWLTGSRKKIKKYISERYQIGETIYNHAHVHIFNDTEVEVHFTPSWLYSFQKNNILQKWFSTFKEDCRFDFKEQYGYKSPTIEFDLVFLMLHAYRHLMHEGLGLRQVMDYYFTLIARNSNDDDKIRKTLSSLGLMKFASAMMYVMQVVFGLEEKYMICKPDANRGKRLLAEIERGGNMGRGDDRTGNSTNRVGYFWEHVSRQWSFMRDYPSEVLWSPLWKTWHYVWRKYVNDQ
ncbi:MAG: nucleotidyltransferase family protein [Prevotella sp.]|nr:nucleotidyltransferase family protein [Prevotella sp.]